jgi:hypothetical protein
MKQGLEATLEVADAVAIFNERRLYRFTHDTFEKWGNERFGLSRPRLYQLLDLKRLNGNVPELLSTAVDIPLGDFSLRPIAQLPEPEQHQRYSFRTLNGPIR